MNDPNHPPGAPAGYVEVSQDQFFASVGQLNVHPRLVGRYPYASEWRLQGSAHQPMVGWSREGRYYIAPRDRT